MTLDMDWIRIGKQLREIRTASKLTQAQVAEKTGLTDGMVSHIEKGIRNPTLETLEKIATASGGRLELNVIAMEADSPVGKLMDMASGLDDKDLEVLMQVAELLPRVSQDMKGSTLAGMAWAARQAD